MNYDDTPLPMPPGDWQERAACRNHPEPDIFHPVSRHPDAAAEAKAVCARCPVVAECMNDADENNMVGVWGGVWRDGRRVRARNGQPPTNHGTDRDYQRHYSAGEPPCDPCKAAHAARKLELAAIRRSA